jgi:hypothetical protein
MQKVEGLMTRISETVNTITTAFTGIENAAKKIGSFKRTVDDKLFKPIKSILSKFAPVKRILDKFNFLKTVFDHRLCFKIPIIGKKCLPTIREIGDFVERVINKIKDIPFVGWAVSAAEDLIDKAISAVFPKIPL